MKLKIFLLATSFALSHNASSREVEAKIYCGNDEGTIGVGFTLMNTTLAMKT